MFQAKLRSQAQITKGNWSARSGRKKATPERKTKDTHTLTRPPRNGLHFLFQLRSTPARIRSSSYSCSCSCPPPNCAEACD